MSADLLLRTLLRDVGFGEVSHRPSTTRHVEGARLSVDGEALLELYDTPRPGRRHRPARAPRAPGTARRATWTARRASAASSTAPRRASASSRRPGAAPAAGQRRRPVRDRRPRAGAGQVQRMSWRCWRAAANRCCRYSTSSTPPTSARAEWREALARLGLHALVALRHGGAAAGRRAASVRKPGPADRSLPGRSWNG